MPSQKFNALIKIKIEKIVKKIDTFPKKILFSKKDKLKFEMIKFSLKKITINIINIEINNFLKGDK